jgi:hypothetical protein
MLGRCLWGICSRLPRASSRDPELLAALDSAGGRLRASVDRHVRGREDAVGCGLRAAKLAAGVAAGGMGERRGCDGASCRPPVCGRGSGIAGRSGKDFGLVVRRLRRLKGEQCLVVCDNAADADVLRPYLTPGHRYASFDYCFNYFLEARSRTDRPADR